MNEFRFFLNISNCCLYFSSIVL